jgi:hypothetical protein
LFQECPTGMVDEDSFKHIFSQFFPLGGKFIDIQLFVFAKRFITSQKTYAQHKSRQFGVESPGMKEAALKRYYTISTPYYYENLEM